VEILDAPKAPPRAAPAKERSRLQELDYLRAYAVGFVVILHVIGAYMGTSPELEHFFANTDFGMGVDIFFAISGFVIAQSLREFWTAQNVPLSTLLSKALVFYQKRFIRLWPSAAFWLLVSLACAVIWHANGMWPNLTLALKGVVSGFVYISDFANYKQPTVLGYYWSLAIEWQFYVALPMVLIFFQKNWLRVAVIFAAMTTSIALTPGGPSWWMFRFDGIVYGVIAYVMFQQVGVVLPRFKTIEHPLGSAVFTLILLVAIAVIPPAVQPYRIGASYAALLGAVLVSFGAANRGYISTFGMKRFVSWLGSRSYTIYLCHFPALLIGRSVIAHFITVYGAENPTRPELFASLALILALIAIMGELSYRFIEKPSHKASQAISFRIREG